MIFTAEVHFEDGTSRHFVNCSVDTGDNLVSFTTLEDDMMVMYPIHRISKIETWWEAGY